MMPATAQRVEAAIRRGLLIDPTRRPASVGAFVESLASDEEDTLPTGTVSVLSTSIVGVIALWESHPLSMPGVLARHDVIVDRVVGRHGGVRIDGSLGDGTTASMFERATHAVRAAIALATTSSSACATDRSSSGSASTQAKLLPTNRRGPVVNRATAIRGLAEGGQVLVSRATTEVLDADRLEGLGLVTLGLHRLPGFEEQEPITAIAAAGLDVPPDPAIPPYPGLAPFGLADADIFMGRDEAVIELRAHDGARTSRRRPRPFRCGEELAAARWRRAPRSRRCRSHRGRRPCCSAS